MSEKDILKLKEKLMQPGWTEDLHHSLKQLKQTEAKQIVEAMTDNEIYLKVNNRKFQQDYISDYIRYLWEISETAYWKHVKTTVSIKHGLLWSDHMAHFEKMCNLKIPDDVWTAVLDFAIACDEKNKQDIEAIGCVIKAQVEKFGRLNEIKKHISLIESDEQTKVEAKINKMINCVCKYQFP